MPIEAMTATVEIQERLFPYALDEYERWCRSAPDIVCSLVARCGLLRRNPSTYTNQTRLHQNYPEVRYAVHLVEQEGFPRDGILYENYTLSHERLQALLRGNSLRALSARRVIEVLSPAFFAEFDRLCALNAADLRPARGNLLVDLCAVDVGRRRVRFVEVKKYNKGAARTEPFRRDQQLTLAFLRHIFSSGQADWFRYPSWSAAAELVVFVSQEDHDAARVPPRTYVVNYLA